VVTEKVLNNPGAAPVARISRAALAANLAAVGPRPGFVVDLRADAYGHGAAAVAAWCERLGAGAVRTDGGTGSGSLPEAAPDVAALDAAEVFGLAAGWTPVMRFSGTALVVKDLRAGEGVSYGFRHRAAHDTRIALVTGGYAQGIVRALGGAGEVLIGGARHPIVGRVAMDVCMVDIGEADIRRGDEAVFFGDARLGEPSVMDWAVATGLHETEIVTAVGRRALREERG
jgi:alanine racemase